MLLIVCKSEFESAQFDSKTLVEVLLIISQAETLPKSNPNIDES